MELHKHQIVRFLCLAILIPSIVCPPVKPEQGKKKEEKKEHGGVKDEEYGLEYERYLKEIFDALEKDEIFKNKIMKDPELKAKDISQHLEFVSHGVRTKLDEIKRTEVERLRGLIHLKVQQLKEAGHRPEPGRSLEESIRHLLPDSEHLDIKNPHSFEIKDLDRLIKKATSDLDELDKERKEDFKKYELEKEHQRRLQLAKLSPEERKKVEEHFQEMKKKHKDHPKLHEPGSKAQLEEVWEEEDHMDKDSFDPKSFFKLHDLDGDGHLEPDEVEGLVEREVAKAYEPGHEEDDLNEKYEEINRMREEMFKRYDKDHDGLISQDEFLDMSKTKDFQDDDGWKGLDDEDVFTDEELAAFEKEREAEEAAEAGHHEQPGVVHMEQGQGQGQAHHEQPPAHHEQPPAHHEQPPAHHEQPPTHHEQPPAHHEQPNKTPGHPAPADHKVPPVQSKPGTETHAPPQHPPLNINLPKL